MKTEVSVTMATDEEVKTKPVSLGSRFASKRPQTDGWVYAIGPGDGLIKIGWTMNLKRRLTELQCGSPVPLKLFAAKRGASWLSGLEWSCWKARESGPMRFGNGEITQRQCDLLRLLSDEADGWWHWTEHGARFASLSNWRNYVRARATPTEDSTP